MPLLVCCWSVAGAGAGAGAAAGGDGGGDFCFVVAVVAIVVLATSAWTQQPVSPELFSHQRGPFQQAKFESSESGDLGCILVYWPRVGLL